jgi:hypothetical protein
LLKTRHFLIFPQRAPSVRSWQKPRVFFPTNKILTHHLKTKKKLKKLECCWNTESGPRWEPPAQIRTTTARPDAASTAQARPRPYWTTLPPTGSKHAATARPTPTPPTWVWTLPAMPRSENATNARAGPHRPGRKPPLSGSEDAVTARPNPTVSDARIEGLARRPPPGSGQPQTPGVAAQPSHGPGVAAQSLGWPSGQP